MKTFIKIIGVVLALAVMCGTIVSISARTFTGILGDADNNGQVNILDATRIQRTLAELYHDDDGIVATLGDVNENGLDILDATLIQRWLADFDLPYSIGETKEFDMEDPTGEPTEEPTEETTEAPTEAPTDAPTEAPTEAPTDAPTEAPTEAPTDAPTEAPTEAPTQAPTKSYELPLV